MFYVKNLPGWERVMRVFMGVVALFYIYAHWGAFNYSVGVAIGAAMISLTGLMGFCPMCAMVGRNLDKAK